MSGLPGSEEAPRRRSGFRAFFDHSVVRYLIAGGLAFLVDFGLLALFHEVLGIATWLAAGLAFIISFAFTYTIQRVFSFGSQVPHGPALLKYTTLVAVNTIATAVIVAVVDTSPLSWAGGKIIATCVTTIWNYFAYRYWVFAAPRRTTAAAPTARED
ncbi:GtrA family protein [Leifsonia sp. AG29]|uniref:GtrA family protein n=1 Tax=Leifsonia sp. AG29 TaxID=2598860 RepID=UPI00131C54D7|nr:GtrA family protein [Leifsonia sp. AG29]